MLLLCERTHKERIGPLFDSFAAQTCRFSRCSSACLSWWLEHSAIAARAASFWVQSKQWPDLPIRRQHIARHMGTATALGTVRPSKVCVGVDTGLDHQRSSSRLKEQSLHRFTLGNASGKQARPATICKPGWAGGACKWPCVMRLDAPVSVNTTHDCAAKRRCGMRSLAWLFYEH